MNSMKIRRTTYAALYLALAMVLPFVTGQIPEIGSMLCPMHIPALLCGFMCGWLWGGRHWMHCPTVAGCNVWYARAFSNSGCHGV